MVLRPCRPQECLELSGLQEGSYPNLLEVGGHTFEVWGYGQVIAPSADVVTWRPHTGLNVSYETRVELGTPAARVEVTLVHFSTAASATGYDAQGTEVDSATMTGNGPETLSLRGEIARVVLTAPQNETLLLRLCVR